MSDVASRDGGIGDIGETVVRIETLADLPIDVAEAMYSPDFVELATLTAAGLPLVLPMSFTLDLPANCVRFSSPLSAARLAHLARDPRCAVSFSRVTTGHPPILLQGVAALGDVAEGVRRGPARRFTVTPLRIFALSDPPVGWSFPPFPVVSSASLPSAGLSGSMSARSPATSDDLDAISHFETTVVALVDDGGRPISLPVELFREGDELAARLLGLDGIALRPGPASLAGHTWNKDGPRYLALTGRATIVGDALRFRASRALRRA